MNPIRLNGSGNIEKFSSFPMVDKKKRSAFKASVDRSPPSSPMSNLQTFSDIFRQPHQPFFSDLIGVAVCEIHKMIYIESITNILYTIFFNLLAKSIWEALISQFIIHTSPNLIYVYVQLDVTDCEKNLGFHLT